jgi:hemerythrin-like domain-containing protein
MTATSPANPQQVRLPGQAHVAEGPYDQTGMYIMHHAFRRDLARFETAVRRTPIDEAETWAALSRRWERFGEILHHHHQIEDQSIWPLLTTHAIARLDDTAIAMLDDMEAEHGQIGPALAACSEGFQLMVEHPCADHRSELDGKITAARAALLEHLRHEETDALPFLQLVVDHRENQAIEAAAKKGYPFSAMPFMVPWGVDGIPVDLSERVMSEVGAVYRFLLRIFRGRYERADARAFRHA